MRTNEVLTSKVVTPVTTVTPLPTVTPNIITTTTTTTTITNTTKASLRQRCKEILNSYRIGERLNPIDSTFILEEILPLHYDYENKYTPGDYVFVTKPPGSPGRCFSTPTGTFSYLKCLAGSDEPPRAKLMKALRNEVMYQTMAARQKLGATSKEHLDHVKPFITLAEEFLSLQGLTPEEIALKKKGVAYYIECPTLASIWRTYHRDNAVYQLLPASENLSKGCKY